MCLQRIRLCEGRGWERQSSGGEPVVVRRATFVRSARDSVSRAVITGGVRGRALIVSAALCGWVAAETPMSHAIMACGPGGGTPVSRVDTTGGLEALRRRAFLLEAKVEPSPPRRQERQGRQRREAGGRQGERRRTRPRFNGKTPRVGRQGVTKVPAVLGALGVLAVEDVDVTLVLAVKVLPRFPPSLVSLVSWW